MQQQQQQNLEKFLNILEKNLGVIVQKWLSTGKMIYMTGLGYKKNSDQEVF